MGTLSASLGLCKKEYIGHHWLSSQKVNNVLFWYFFVVSLYKLLNKQLSCNDLKRPGTFHQAKLYSCYILCSWNAAVCFHKVMRIYHQSKNGICIASTWRWLNHLYTYIILNFSYGMISWNKYQAYAQIMINVSYKGHVYREASCQICLHVHLCLIWYVFIKYQQQWSGKERTVVT